MKKLITILFTFGILTLLPMGIKASSVTGYANEGDVLFASSPNQEKPGNSCLYKVNGSYSSIYAAPRYLHCLDAGEKITILNYDSIIQSTIASCSKGFYQATHTKSNGKTYTGYICADKVTTNVDTSQYAEEFRNANIPEIYWDKLSLLKQAHPNWKFTGYNTNLNWDDVLNNEIGSNYIQSTNSLYLLIGEGYYNTSTGKYIQQETGGWYAANKQTIGYYMDPRNFFDEKSIFMFENLGYNSSYQTKAVVDTILSGTSLSPYSDTFIQAATYNGNNVSPIMLAARSRQEVVKSDGTLSNSANGSTGYFNFYNLGAFSTCANPIECATNFASGYGGAYTTYNRPWTNAEAAILNGANYIANSYINQRQNTLYFQKFNVTSNSYGNYSHQYMTNVMAPYSEANSTYKSYANIPNLLNSTIEFIIPVYNNMPGSAVTLPTTIDNSAIEQMKQNQTNNDVSASITNAGYSVTGAYLVNVNINTTARQMIEKLNTQVNIDKDGKSISGDEVLGTADILTIGGSSFRIIINGDANGDGKITPADYVKIKNYIVGSSSLSGSFRQASDVNGDGKITPADYVNVKNYIMGNASTLK